MERDFEQIHVLERADYQENTFHEPYRYQSNTFYETFGPETSPERASSCAFYEPSKGLPDLSSGPNSGPPTNAALTDKDRPDWMQKDPSGTGQYLEENYSNKIYGRNLSLAQTFDRPPSSLSTNIISPDTDTGETDSPQLVLVWPAQEPDNAPRPGYRYKTASCFVYKRVYKDGREILGPMFMTDLATPEDEPVPVMIKFGDRGSEPGYSKYKLKVDGEGTYHWVERKCDGVNSWVFGSRVTEV